MLSFLASSRGITWAWGAQQTHVRRSQQISAVSSSIFITVSEELLKKVTRLGLWGSGHHVPLPFTFSDGPTYADTGERSVWVRGGASGLEKCQCTAQLTIFADGEPRVKPLLIFRGMGKQITLAEKVRYDRRVSVVFQPKAWCDERVMHHWVRTCWKPACQGPMHLILDVHKAQKTEAVQAV